MPFAFRPALRTLTPVVHGSAPAEELRAAAVGGVKAIDFSVNTNPLGPPPGALAAVAGLDRQSIWRYPDPDAVHLRRAIAQTLGVDPAGVVPGNGAAELIWTVALAAVRPAPESVLVVGPTFGEYERASRLLGARVVTFQASQGEGFLPDVPRVASAIERERPSLVWLCNPNNPTGRYLAPREVASLHDACRAAGALLVVDEAYLSFVDEPHAAGTGPAGRALLDLLPGGHLVLLRSMTKDYGLAGLRLGYALAAPALAAGLCLAQPPWSVNAPAQAAGCAALADPDHLERARGVVRTAREALVAGLEALGFRVTPPAANFLLVEAGTPGTHASRDGAALRAALLRRGCVVRDCASFGLPGHVRIGVRTLPECRRLLEALAAVTSGGAAGATRG